MLNIAVLVSGGGSNLQAMLDAKANGEMADCHFSLVLSNKENAFALERAKAKHIPTLVLPKIKGESHEAYGQKLVKALAPYQIDLVVLAGFLVILDKDVIKTYENKIINVHPSLIPSFCGEGYYGLTVHKEALARGVKVTGATVHLVNDIVDGGKILAQKAVDILADDTPETLQRRVMEQAEWILLPQVVQQYAKTRSIP